MSYTKDNNIWTKTDGQLMWQLKEHLVAGGWSVASSGDGGSAYSATGDVHTVYTTLDPTLAWMRLRAPSGMSPRREFILQNIAGTGSVRIWYSSDGTGFTGGSPNATTRPTAADEQGVINFPSGSSFVWPNEGGIYCDFWIGDSAEQWSFFMGARDYGKEYYMAGFYLDVVDWASASDIDPAVIGIEIKANARFVADETLCNIFSNKSNPTASTGGTRGWYKKGLAGAAWVAFPPCLWGSNDGTANVLVSMSGTARRWDMNSAKKFPELICHYRRGDGFTTEKGFKGISRLFKVITMAAGPQRKNHDGSRLSIGALSLPWDDGTQVI